MPETFLGRHWLVALDSSVFIYQLESNSRHIAFTDYVFSWLERPSSKAVTSTITMTELLVQPYREHNQQRVNLFFGLLSTYPNLQWFATDLAVANSAARIRTEFQLRTPDAIHAATAVHTSASGFITNDPVFQRVPSFETLVLDLLH